MKGTFKPFRPEISSALTLEMICSQWYWVNPHTKPNIKRAKNTDQENVQTAAPKLRWKKSYASKMTFQQKIQQPKPFRKAGLG